MAIITQFSGLPSIDRLTIPARWCISVWRRTEPGTRCTPTTFEK
jgi:hypothetical protein